MSLGPFGERIVKSFVMIGLDGGDEGIRTLDLLSASYTPSVETIEVTGFHLARRGETRQETALSAPYTHPD